MSKNNIELEEVKRSKITVLGKDLNVRWFDSYIMIWSGKEHPHDNIHEKKKEVLNG